MLNSEFVDPFTTLQQQLKMAEIGTERELLPLGTLNGVRKYGRYLQLVPPEELNGGVQTGTRLSDKEWSAAKKQRIKQWYADKAAENKMPLVQSIWSEWYDSDPASWPKELKRFWSDVSYSYTDNRAIVQSIRTYYPDDKQLLERANFIEYWTAQNLKLTLESKYRTFGETQDLFLAALLGIGIASLIVAIPTPYK
jgi:hypothetical protein